MKKLYLKTLSVICLSLFAFNSSAQITYYVKTNGTGTAVAATSWGTASKDLQDVINTAQSGDKIFLEQGTYVPNRPANTPNVIDAANRDNAFVLKNGVSIYGGFAGTETNETQRVAGNLTILSGDLGGDDVGEITNPTNYMTFNKADNAYHVVLAIGINSETILDGFTITKASASANSVSTLSVNAKEIDRRYGGGIYILDATADFKISNVTATVNRANGDGYGVATGAGFYINNSSPTIASCEINKNFNMNGTPKTSGNNYGSGMSLVISSSPVITNTTFSDNFGLYGAAVSINGGSAKFTNCIFKLNRGNGRGGAVDIRGASPVFTNCLFSENSTGNEGGGGAIYNYSGRPTFLNCIFYNNATSSNGGIYATGNGTHNGAVFINNTFYGNKNTRTGSALSYTAGIQIQPASTSNSAEYPNKKTNFYNNIFYNNTFTVASSDTGTPDLYIANTTTSLGDVFNNIIQQASYVPADQDNVSGDPQFISVVPAQLAFLAPQSGGLANDKGEDSYNVSLLDFNGRARKNGTIDIGAVEYYAILPVSFISFTAKASTAGAQLNWRVASETNNKRYIISRSSDGKNYDLVTKINGRGTIDASLSYGYTDQTVGNGVYYYKLEQEDLDGKINYLATQVVRISLSGSLINVYPNPTKGNATIAINEGVYKEYAVVSLHGNTLLNGSIGIADQQINLDLSGLAAGTYVIKLKGANNNKSIRIIKL